MANEGYTLEQIDRKRRYIENQITELALQGSGLVPTNEGKVQMMMLGEELFRMSDGRNQLIFDKAGRPHIMVNFFCNEKARLDYLAMSNTLFNSADTSLKSALHPAFIMDNTPIRGFRLAKYLMPRVGGVNYVASLYNLSPAWGSGGFSVSTEGTIAACYASNTATTNPDGEEVHLETLAENSYLYLMGARRAFECHGNTNYNKYHGDSTEQGSPAEYTYNNTTPQTRTGTGPLEWYHDGTPWGVADLVGNMAEWCSGFRLKSGELQFIPNNNAGKLGITPSDLGNTSTLWKALKEDGSWVEANADDESYKYDYLADISSGSAAFQLVKTLEHQQSDDSPYGSIALKSMTAKDGTTANAYLRIMGLFPLLASTPNGQAYMRNTEGVIKAVRRGGYWSSSSSAGLGYTNCADGVTSTYNYVGARSASKIK